MSVLSDILDKIVDLEQTAALSISGNELTVVKRKLPKAEDTVDAEYQVTVSGAERVDLIRRLAFGDRYIVTYQIEITLIIPASDALSDLDAVTDWREAVRARYMKIGVLDSVGAATVNIDPGILFDRTFLNKNYDYDQILLTVVTYEDRSS